MWQFPARFQVRGAAREGQRARGQAEARLPPKLLQIAWKANEHFPNRGNLVMKVSWRAVLFNSTNRNCYAKVAMHDFVTCLGLVAFTLFSASQCFNSFLFHAFGCIVSGELSGKKWEAPKSTETYVGNLWPLRSPGEPSGPLGAPASPWETLLFVYKPLQYFWHVVQSRP
jgi:hypothetical protein